MIRASGVAKRYGRHVVLDGLDLHVRRGERVALVPTMGFLHEGHLSLVRLAQERADRVVVSIFVNPTQFGPNEDFDDYPRDFDSDLAKLRPLGVDAVFAPPVEAVYPEGDCSWVEVEKLGAGLCGRGRPGHFRGVTTVVTRLFHAARPHLAVFGAKDYQQLQVIRHGLAFTSLPGGDL